MEHDRVDIDGVQVSVDHYIGGRRVGSQDTFEDRSPLDWTRKLADVSAGDDSTAALAIDAALAAAPGWAAMSVTDRGAHLRHLADLIDANVDRIATV